MNMGLRSGKFNDENFLFISIEWIKVKEKDENCDRLDYHFNGKTIEYCPCVKNN